MLIDVCQISIRASARWIRTLKEEVTYWSLSYLYLTSQLAKGESNDFLFKQRWIAIQKGSLKNNIFNQKENQFRVTVEASSSSFVCCCLCVWPHSLPPPSRRSSFLWHDIFSYCIYDSNGRECAAAAAATWILFCSLAFYSIYSSGVEGFVLARYYARYGSECVEWLCRSKRAIWCPSSSSSSSFSPPLARPLVFLSFHCQSRTPCKLHMYRRKRREIIEQEEDEEEEVRQ